MRPASRLRWKELAPESESDLHVLLLEDRRYRRPRGEPHHVRVGEGLALLRGPAGALREGRVQRSARLDLVLSQQQKKTYTRPDKTVR